MNISRRSALLGLPAAFCLGRTSLAFAAPAIEQRFVVVLLRGAMDGLAAVQPYGDRNLAGLRGELLLPPPGQAGGVLDLGGFYGLHPSLANVHGMYMSGEVLVLHAAAGHYRSRSHFEAQDYLESGADERLSSGWLNRAVALLPARSGQDLALSVGLSAPLILRGATQVQAWAPEHFAQPSLDLYQRVLAVTARDALVGPAIAEGLKQRGADDSALAGSLGDPRKDHGFEVLAGAAGRLLAQAGGPRIAALELTGWDTHAAQLPRLADALAKLDGGLAAMKASMGPAWSKTVVLAVTEFGRTARVNGTKGTDHGTAGVAFLAGGAVAGGRVLADWPGLADDKLFEHRDLAPTMDVRGVIKGVLVRHLGVPAARLGEVLPGSSDASAVQGLVRA